MAANVLQTTAPPLLPAVEAVLARPLRMLIGGRHVAATSGRSRDVENPATGRLLASVPEGDGEDVELAVAAARAAFDGEWSRATPSDRSRMLWSFADLLEAHADELAQLITLEMGKPFAVARHGELADAI